MLMKIKANLTKPLSKFPASTIILKKCGRNTFKKENKMFINEIFNVHFFSKKKKKKNNIKKFIIFIFLNLFSSFLPNNNLRGLRYSKTPTSPRKHSFI